MIKKIAILFLALSFSLAAQAQSYAEQVLASRKEKEASFINNPLGPVKADQVQYVNYFPVKEAYKVTATVELLQNEKSFRMPTYDGTSNAYKRYAVFTFELNGQQQQLTAYQSAALFQNPAYKDHLFVPFLDATNGNETYAGGKYLDLSIADIKNGKITIDFNLAYNPYCAYSNGYRCPVPPKENFLNTAILAGEKAYSGPKNDRPVNTSLKTGFSERESALILAADTNSLMRVLQTTEVADTTILRASSADIAFNDPLIATLAKRMLATVKDPAKPGVGIAAPQVGISKNLIWVQRFDKKDQPFEFYINPKITWRSKLLIKGSEGCLSIPNQKDDVLRSQAIRLEYIDSKGNVLAENIEGFTAVIFQHEVDHLYGILFPDRIQDQKEETFEELNERTIYTVKAEQVKYLVR